jgi:hypothetical protein
MMKRASKTPRSFAGLREELRPPHEPTRAVAEFVGRDKGKTHCIGLLLGTSGAIEAFVTDGNLLATWLTGTIKGNKAKASGPGKAALDAVLENRRFKGEARLAGKALTFTLEPANEACGVRRMVNRVGGRDVESVFVITNDGAIYGASSSDGRVAYSYREEVTETPDGGDPVIDHTGAGGGGGGGKGGDPSTRAFFKRLKCTILLAKWSALERTWQLHGQLTPEQRTKLDNIVQRFNQAGCTDIFAIPDVS